MANDSNPPKTGLAAEPAQVKSTSPPHNAVKLIGEAFLPGASLLMDGKIANGGVHVIAGMIAKALLGPVGAVLVIANSYSNSTTGKNVLKQFQSPTPPASPPTTGS